MVADLATNIPEASKCLRTDAQLFVAKQRSKGLESFVISTIHVIQFTTLSVTHLLTHSVLKFLLKDMKTISPVNSPTSFGVVLEFSHHLTFMQIRTES